MSYTRAQIRQRIGGAAFCNDMVTSAASATGALAGATLIDTTMKGDDDAYNGHEIVISSGTALGDCRMVSDWVSSTGTYTPDRNFSAQIASAVTYERHRLYPANGNGTGLGKNSAINQAILLAGPLWSEHIEDETITFLTNTWLYSLAGLSTNPVDREWGIDKIEYDPAAGTTGYEWVEIDDDAWFIRDIAGTLKLQFRSNFNLPTAATKMRLSYRKRPPVLTTDAGVLVPNSDSFYHWVCFKATELLLRDASRNHNEDARGILAQQADQMAAQAEKYIERQAQKKPAGKVLLPTWGNS
jgi:hypothetical protein